MDWLRRSARRTACEASLQGNRRRWVDGVSFIWKWLRPQRPSGVALHPSQMIELDLPRDAAYERCLEGIDRVLGGSVRETDQVRGRIEATFGLIGSERLSCIVESLDPIRSRVTIESRRAVIAETPRTTSDYVKALADFLRAK